MAKACNIEALSRRRKDVMDKIAFLHPLTRGSVVELKRPCTYKNCRKCKEGVMHPAMYLSTNKSGKTHIIYLPKYAVKSVNKAVENYKKIKVLLYTLCEIDLQILLYQLKQVQKG